MRQRPVFGKEGQTPGCDFQHKQAFYPHSVCFQLMYLQSAVWISFNIMYRIRMVWDVSEVTAH